MMSRFIAVLSVLLSILALGACGVTAEPTSAIMISDPWVRAAVVVDAMPEEPTAMSMSQDGAMADEMDHNNAMGSTSAAYMTLRNTGDADDALIGATTDVAATVELHTVERDGDVMRMRPIKQIDLPSNGSAELKPGDYHIMLIGLKQDLQTGDSVTLTLTFQNAAPMTISAAVHQP